ncbi:hypothetical protein FHR92_004437 [Fontibacillus solani]|uniref:Uncharacterized protein n=1 Tax=Fontibacillus solani TaxID=1572857 RepID=A0A7W3SXI3_9BACL|nr:hypothetical protein [Fontibacillus solani]MBA9087944.1 hypothetical protein [Fontibacillus solani]
MTQLNSIRYVSLAIVKQEQLLHLPNTFGKDIKDNDIASTFFVFTGFLVSTRQANHCVDEAEGTACPNENNYSFC